MSSTAMTIDPLLEPTVKALNALSPRGRELVKVLVRQVAENEGINIPVSAMQGLQTPSKGIPLWIAKLKAEQYSKTSIHMYQYLVRRYLERDPMPTKLGVQQYLAERLEQASSAYVSNERKALASFFGFLHSEGLWPINPMSGIRHIRVKYREKLCPDIADILKVLSGSCLRKKDSDKLKMLVLLLATTGLRISEAAGILKDNINLDALELMVTGKGDKQRIVPLPEITATAIGDYIRRYPTSSPYLFPGNTETGHACIHNFEKTLKRACRRAGVDPFTPHQLRHLYATTMLRSGAKLEVVAKILGHASVGVTGDIYRHVYSAELHETARQFAPFNRLPPILLAERT